MVEGILENIGLGAVSGLFLAGAGYIKSQSPDGKLQNFDPIKFGTTIILGGTIGGISGATGIAPEFFVSLPMYAGITAVVENVLKAIKRKFFG